MSDVNCSRKIKKVLVIRFRRIGDAILSSVVCTNLRLMFPEAEIHYVLNETIAGLFQGHPDIDRLISFSTAENENRYLYLKKVRSLMKKERYDVIIDTRSTLKTLYFSLFSLGTPYRIGEWKWYTRFGHNYRIRSQSPSSLDEVRRTLLLLSPLTPEEKPGLSTTFKLYITEKEVDVFRSYMEKEGIDFSSPVIVCNPFPRLSHKAWDAERMKEIMRRILNYREDIQVVLNYTKDEKEKACHFCKEMNNHPRIFTNIEADSLRKLGAMLSLSDFFWGHEGGPRHLAQALDIPSLALYPPETDKVKWLPNPGNRYQGISPSDVASPQTLKNLTFRESFNLITVDEVWKRLQPMLDEFVCNKRNNV